MARAAFRIDITQDIHNETFPWDWEVIDLANLIPIGRGYAKSQGEAETQASEWVKRHTASQPQSFEFFVDEQGEPASRPQS